MKKFFANIVAKLVKKFVCYTLANDIDAGVGGISSGLGFQSAVLNANRGTNNLRNVLAVIDMPHGQTVSGVKYAAHKIFVYYCASDPDDSTEMDGAPIGSYCIQLSRTAGVVTGANTYQKTDATTWTPVGDLA